MNARQVQGILGKTDFLDPFQSGFRPGYVTETALVTLTDDFWWEKDGDSATILTLLDLCLVFNTIYHDILLVQLCELGLGDMVCFSVFLQG